jgi:hypothetical protein
MLGTARCLTRSGTCGAIVRTTDGGSSFVGIPSPPVSANAVTQLRFANALDGYAFDPQFWVTTNGGTSWQQVHTTGEVTEVQAADGEAYALVCATSSTSCQGTRLLRSQVGSSDWQSLPTPTRLGYDSQFAVSGPTLYVLPGARHHVLLYSANQGTNFTDRVDPCNPSLTCSVSTAADGSPSLWSASPTGTQAAVFVSSNSGATWHAASPSSSFPNSLQVTAASSSVALVWPGPQVSDQLPAALDRTTNGGRSYTAVLSSSWTVSWAGFSDPARSYALATRASTGAGGWRLFESDDGGVTWQEVAIRR